MAGTVYVDKILTDTGTTVNVSGVHFSKTGNVGIGTSSPTTILNAYNATSAIISVDGDSTTNFRASRYSSDGTGAQIFLRKARGTLSSPTAVNTGDSAAGLIFSAYGGSNFRAMATITSGVETYTADDNISGALIFNTRPAGAGAAVTERMRIDSSGNVGIGTSSPSQKLHLAGGSTNWVRVDDTTNSVFNLFGSSLGVGYAGTFSNHPFAFVTNSTERARINSDGSITFMLSGATNSTHNFVYNENGGEISLSDETGAAATLLDQSSNTTRLLELVNGSNLQVGLGASNTTGVIQFIRAGFNEAVRIDASGFTQFNSNLVMPYQGAPTSKSGAATLTGAELVTGILNTTGTTYTITLPTGTNIEGALTWSANNVSLDWYVINTASGTITIGANGNTTLGSLTIATGTSAHFRIRRTAANTFTVYRL